MSDRILAAEKIDEIQDFMRGFYVEHGFAPTYREIGEAIGVKSTQTIHHLVHIMMDDGVVTLVRGHPRTLRLVDNDQDGNSGPRRRAGS